MTLIIDEMGGGKTMGAWGTSLYANDVACDIRGDYVEKLRSGKSNSDATRELMTQWADSLADSEEAPLFWFALADTQWNYGRLLPEVKEKALCCLSQDTEMERWRESGERQASAWAKTLQALGDKLNSPQPAPKKLRQYRTYKCTWNLGDTFAYQLTSDYSRTMGYEGKYAAFRKVSEDVWYPKHIVPVVQIYLWLSETPPTLEDLKEAPVLPAFKKPQNIHGEEIEALEKNVKLICESPKSIPKDNLIFLGNIGGGDLTPFRGYEYWTGYPAIGWESSKYNHKIEHYIIDMYQAWTESPHL